MSDSAACVSEVCRPIRSLGLSSMQPLLSWSPKGVCVPACLTADGDSSDASSDSSLRLQACRALPAVCLLSPVKRCRCSSDSFCSSGSCSWAATTLRICTTSIPQIMGACTFSSQLLQRCTAMCQIHVRQAAIAETEPFHASFDTLMFMLLCENSSGPSHASSKMTARVRRVYVGPCSLRYLDGPG